METNNLFTKHQYGFRKGYSCATQLIGVIDEWTRLLDNRDEIDVIYLDFQKAFDTVPHARLLNKLYAYGIRGKVHAWLKEYLNQRKQRVILNGEKSGWAEVTSGIPQGTVLGPILFLIYINDLPEVVTNAVKLFADDTKLYGKSNNNQDHSSLQQDICNLLDWSDRWQLKFNPQKCKHMHLGGLSLPDAYMMGDVRIEPTTVEKDLGIQIDNKLKFIEHIHLSVKTANQRLGIIRRNFHYLDKESFTTLYKSIVRPHLEYASSAWSTVNKREAALIENTQRRATKLIKDISHLPYTQRMKILGIPSLEYRRIRCDMIQVFKYVKGIDVVDENLLTPSENTRTRGNKYKLAKPHCRLNIRKFSFVPRIVNVWNSLPDHVVDSPNINIFKSRLNTHWKDQNIKFNPSCIVPNAPHQRLSNNTREDLEGRQAIG
ncbi:hypothetical protein FSP39_018740 [Pinctada imbricata]|uniref:Reverse transcriptase domain-containing protein n=1 Tax=Pinctada imbricata TaxID=66713 RepID=A0AA88XX39_PINIB|nr:hypothetical protein FSP39_018740 [Pinctada imbricata]